MDVDEHPAQDLEAAGLPASAFPDVTGAARRDLADALTTGVVHAGDVVVTAGEPSDSLYLVVRGRLRVVLGDGRHVDVGRGQTIGEIGLISGGTRSATVMARRDSVLARLSLDDFRRLVRQHPLAMLGSFAAPIIDRLRLQVATGSSGAQRSAVAITILPLDDSGIGARVARLLEAALQDTGSVRLLDRRSCEQALAADIAVDMESGSGDAELVAVLDAVDSTNDVTLLLADDAPTPWTNRCVRHADVVLLVADATNDAAATEVEGCIPATTSVTRGRCELLLVHADDVTLPSDTMRWLVDRQLDAHHHVRLGSSRDLDRLARMVTGRGRGVVLSGGGARAMAHLGVVRALAEADVAIDGLGATSGGAIIAALTAMGLDATDALRRVEDSSNRVDYTLPFHAMTSGRNWTDSMRQLFGDVQIEDLWLPFFCVSTNLSKPGLEVHRTGSLLHAVRSTTAIPGLLPPVFHDGEVLIDGGLMNNLPVDVMREGHGVTHVTAVDVGVSQPLRGVDAFDYELSGWRSLWRRLTRRGSSSGMPSLGDVLQLAMTMANTVSAERTRELADVRIEPPVADFALLDFDRAAEMAKLAHAYTLDLLDSLR